LLKENGNQGVKLLSNDEVPTPNALDLVTHLGEVVQFINSYLCPDDPLEKGMDDMTEDFVKDETEFMEWLAK